MNMGCNLLLFVRLFTIVCEDMPDEDESEKGKYTLCMLVHFTHMGFSIIIQCLLAILVYGCLSHGSIIVY